MVQTVSSYKILAGKKMIVLEKPHSLHRIFFSICRIQEQTSWYEARISFDDPLFLSFYALNGSNNCFKNEGVDIFQGDVWVLNVSDTDLWFTVTEILC